MTEEDEGLDPAPRNEKLEDPTVVRSREGTRGDFALAVEISVKARRL